MIIDKKNLVILEVQSESGNSSKMEFTVIERLRELKLEPSVDDYGNIYATRGKSIHYPMLTAHLDTVHKYTNGYKVVYGANNTVCAYDNKMRPTGIGGDDKCGIIAIFEIIEQTKHPIKIVFFKDEEIGCVGSSEVDVDFLSDVSYIVGIDRNGNTDILTGYGNFNTSDEFLKLLPTDAKLKVKGQDTVTDSANVGELYNISNVNISCGYFLPHSDKEYIDLVDLHNTIQYVIRMLREIPTSKIYLIGKDPHDKYANWKKENSSFYPTYYNNTDDFQARRSNKTYKDYGNKWGGKYGWDGYEYGNDDESIADDDMTQAERDYYGLDDNKYESDADTDYVTYSLEEVCKYFDGGNDTETATMLTYFDNFEEFMDDVKMRYSKKLHDELISDITFYECDVEKYFGKDVKHK